MTNLYLRLFVWLFAGAQISASGGDIAFKAGGRITYEVFSDNVLERSFVRDFKLAVQGCKWIVESSSANDDFYALKSYEGGVINNVGRIPAAATNAALNKYASVVETEDVPGDDASGISFIWLAYCSACYLNSVTSNKFKPIWLLDDLTLRKEGYTMKGFLKKADGGLPDEMIYFHDGLTYGRTKEGRTTRRAPPPFQDGFTNAIYQMLESTNFGPWRIPLKFEFVRFGVPHRNMAPLDVRCKISGELKTPVRNAVASDFSPKLEGRIYVDDTRFRIHYNTTNFKVLKSDDPALLRELERSR